MMVACHSLHCVRLSVIFLCRYIYIRFFRKIPQPCRLRTCARLADGHACYSVLRRIGSALCALQAFQPTALHRPNYWSQNIGPVSLGWQRPRPNGY